SVQATWARPDAYTIQVVRGPARSRLHAGRSHGPFPAEELSARHAEVLDALRAEGFARGGLVSLVSALERGDAGDRARAALRLGWLGDRSAVDALLAASARA